MKLQKDRIQQLSDLAGCPMNKGELALSLACVDVQDMKHDIATTKAATVIQARGPYHLPHTIDNATLHNNTERSTNHQLSLILQNAETGYRMLKRKGEGSIRLRYSRQDDTEQDDAHGCYRAG